jgi:hypothetical protein
MAHDIDGLPNTLKEFGYSANGLENNLPPLGRTKVYSYFLLHTDVNNRCVKTSFTKGNKQEGKCIRWKYSFHHLQGAGYPKIRNIGPCF